MKIEDLIAGKDEQETISIDGSSVPVKALKNLVHDGYIHVQPYRGNKTFSFWGKSCTACFTLDQLLKRA